MAKVNLELGTDLTPMYTAFGKGNELIEQSSVAVNAFGKDAKTAFSTATTEVDKFDKEVAQGTKDVNNLEKSVTAVGKSANRIKEIKAEIKALTSEAIKAGAGTKIFEENLRKVGQLKDELNDINAAISAVAGNLGENLAKAAGETTSLIAKGFEASTAASALFGEKNEEVEKQLLRLQAVQSLANIAKEFAGIGDKLTELKLALAPVGNLYTKANGAMLNWAQNANISFKSMGAGAKNLFMNLGQGIAGFVKSGIAGIRSLGAAIAANPLGLILTVIALIIGAMIALKDKVKPISDMFEWFGKNIKENTEAMKRFAQSVGLVDSVLVESMKKQIDMVEELNSAIEKRYDREIKVAGAAGANTEMMERKKQEAMFKTVAQAIGNLEGLRKLEGKLNEEQLKKRAELNDKLLDITAEIYAIDAKRMADAKKKREEDEKKRLEKAKADAEKLKQLRKELADFLLDLEKKANAAEIEMLTGEEKINAIRAAAQKEINILRETLVKKRIAAREGNKLTAEDEAEFRKLELLANMQQADALLKLQAERANLVANQRKKEIDSELEFLDLKTKLAIEQVKGAKNDTGLSQEDFEIAKQRVILQIQMKAAQESLQIKKDQLKAEANVQVTALQNEIKLLEGKNDIESQLKVEQANKNIEIIKKTLGLETQVLEEEVKNQVDGIAKEISGLDQKVRKPIDLAKLLGLTDEQFQALQSQIQQLLGSLSDLNEQYFELAQSRLDQELEANKQREQARDNNINDLKRRLAEEEALQRQGLANNVDRLKEEIAAQDAAKQAELERAKKIQEEKKKLAKEQLIIDTALQASQLVLAIANLFAEGSKFWVGPVPVGTIVAGVTAAAMTAAFIAGKVKAFQAVNQGGGFKKGGYTGNIGVDEVAGEVHGQEFVHTADKTRKNRNLFEGIHKDDKYLMHQGILDLIKDKGITLESDLPTKLSGKRDALRSYTRINYSQNNKGLEDRFDKLNSQVAGITKKLNEKITVLPNGDIIHVFGSVTRKIKK